MSGFLLKSCVAGLVLVAVAAYPLEASQLHEANVARAARLFRIQTYQHFRHDRQEYDRRIRLGGQLVDEWYARGAAPWEARRLLDWFQRASTGNGHAGLPAVPSMLERTSELPGGVVLEAMPDIPSRMPPSSGRASQTPAQSGVIDEGLLSEHTPKPVLPHAPSSGQVSGQVERSRPNDETATAYSFKPTVSPPHRQPVIEELLAVRPVPALPLDDVHLAKHLGEVRENESTHPSLVANRFEEFPRTNVATPRSFERSQHTVDVQRVEVDSDKTAYPMPVGTDPTTAINIDVLVARIAGFNLALESVHDELAYNSQLNYTQLEAILDELEGLRSHRDISRLYVRILAAPQRKDILPLQSMKPVLQVLEQRVSKALLRGRRRGESPKEPSQATETLESALQKVKKWTVED